MSYGGMWLELERGLGPSFWHCQPSSTVLFWEDAGNEPEMALQGTLWVSAEKVTEEVDLGGSQFGWVLGQSAEPRTHLA